MNDKMILEYIKKHSSKEDFVRFCTDFLNNTRTLIEALDEFMPKVADFLKCTPFTNHDEIEKNGLILMTTLNAFGNSTLFTTNPANEHKEPIYIKIELNAEKIKEFVREIETLAISMTGHEGEPVQ